MKKPKRKRLDTRAAGLRQAARLCKKHEAFWDRERERPEMDNARAFHSGRAQEAMVLANELERLARAEARRGAR